jgi:hypothetical protein
MVETSRGPPESRSDTKINGTEASRDQLSGSQYKSSRGSGDAAVGPSKQHTAAAAEWQSEGDGGRAAGADAAGCEEDEALVLEEDPAEMSSWIGQPSVKGSSEMLRMVLLTLNSVGITSASLF